MHGVLLFNEEPNSHFVTQDRVMIQAPNHDGGASALKPKPFGAEIGG